MATEDELRAYKKRLSNVSQEDAAAFHELVRDGCDLMHLTDADLSRAFNVSHPTARRWMTGSNAPYPSLRRFVYEWLDRRATSATVRETSSKP